jgi:hypothetical protein
VWSLILAAWQWSWSWLLHFQISHAVSTPPEKYGGDFEQFLAKKHIGCQLLHHLYQEIAPKLIKNKGVREPFLSWMTGHYGSLITTS